MSTSLLTEEDVRLWAQGKHWRAYAKFGAHVGVHDGAAGTTFTVWAPHARAVSVFGDFNAWDAHSHPLERVGSSGIWSRFIPGVGTGATYKYIITAQQPNQQLEKADPFAFFAEVRPRNASRVWNLADYKWGDHDWMDRRRRAHALDAPIATYEVHLGSWRRVPEEDNRWLTYREAAPQLAAYAHDMGFTHVEFMPLMEHPLDASWGYQTAGYFAPTSRFGTPQDFMYLVDTLHQRGIGVILDWVPAHFPRDEHALGYFDGTYLYEHPDIQQREHPDWGTLVFNYGRKEVRNFLIASALFWLDKYHIDGLRVDAVASMLYLDYSREKGEWKPNRFGGRENLEAIEFIRLLSEQVYGNYPDVMTIAEESTAWPQVSRPTYAGGLGFGYKWDMGWMHDTLNYLAVEPQQRPEQHHRLTFRMIYAFNENYVLPLSHDEVVYGKRSLLAKMPGDAWQKFANLRLLLAYQYVQPGKKLLFMGDEFGQWNEWNYDASLDWHLLDNPFHQGLQRWVRDLNTFYRGEPALHQLDCDAAGFEWIDANDTRSSVLSFLRKGFAGNDWRLVVCNFQPLPLHNYRVGVPHGGRWEEILNSDAPLYGGSGQGNFGGVTAAPVSAHGRAHLLTLTIPPLGMVLLKPAR